jgi:uncharacterized membrane protein
MVLIYNSKEDSRILIRQGLTSNALKMIAIAAMTIDHLAWEFFPGYSTDGVALLMHVIGRLTAPIMVFLFLLSRSSNHIGTN